jgi:hypothetical protein
MPSASGKSSCRMAAHGSRARGYDGARRCLINAIRETRNDDDRPLEVAVRRIVKTRGYRSIPLFNDAPSSTFGDVLIVPAEAEAAVNSGVIVALRRSLCRRIVCWS